MRCYKLDYEIDEIIVVKGQQHVEWKLFSRNIRSKLRRYSVSKVRSCDLLPAVGAIVGVADPPSAEPFTVLSFLGVFWSVYEAPYDISRNLIIFEARLRVRQALFCNF